MLLNHDLGVKMHAFGIVEFICTPLEVQILRICLKIEKSKMAAIVGGGWSHIPVQLSFFVSDCPIVFDVKNMLLKYFTVSPNQPQPIAAENFVILFN